MREPPDTISKEEYYKEYASTYGLLDVKDKTVVDIGGDFYGSSVDWFLEHGATHVTAFESDPVVMAAMAEKFRGDPRVEVRGRWKGERTEADVLKMDCEGCEEALDADSLLSFGQFAVALHPEWMPEEKHDELKKRILEAGAKMVLDLVKEQLYVRAA